MQTWSDKQSTHCNISIAHLFALDDVKLDLLTVPDTAQVLARVILGDGCLVHKHVFLRVIPANRKNGNGCTGYNFYLASLAQDLLSIVDVSRTFV